MSQHPEGTAARMVSQCMRALMTGERCAVTR